MKKFIAILVPLILIVIIAGSLISKIYEEKYSYSKEQCDLKEYFKVQSDDELSIVLQDELVDEKVLLKNDICYLEMSVVEKYLNKGFFRDDFEELLIYTDAEKSTKAGFGSESYYNPAEGSVSVGYPICFVQGADLYIALDYVKMFTNFAYSRYETHIQLDTQWGTHEEATVNKDTQIRSEDDRKSPFYRQVYEGETVEVINALDEWSLVKTNDSIVGYIESSKLEGHTTVTENPVTKYVAPEYKDNRLGEKVSLGFHAIYSTKGNDEIDTVTAKTKGMNVIAPTWFSITNEDGTFSSYGKKAYVEKAHSKGLKVWAVVDDFNYATENGFVLDDYELLCTTTKREALATNLVSECVNLGVDGINLDFEVVGSKSGPYFAQFVRELGILCRSNNLTLSIDNYASHSISSYYSLDVQGQVADYVIVMGYDETWSGSTTPGSVASLNYVANGLDRTLENVSADKVINALPMYTLVWKIEGADVTSDYLTWKNVDEYIQKGDRQKNCVWDEESGQNYLEYVSGSTTVKVWLEDKDSLTAKLNLMNARKIAGAAIWRLGYENSEAWDLLQAYVEY